MYKILSLVLSLLSVAWFSSCSLSKLNVSTPSNANTSFLTIAVDSPSVSTASVKPQSSIIVSESQITQAVITLTAPNGTTQTATWLPNGTSSFVFSSSQSGAFLITVSDYDNAGDVNTVSNMVELRFNYNYHVTVTLGGQVYINTVSDSLLAYYPFNGNLNDASGNNLNGTATSTSYISDRFGNASSALYFNGSSAFDIQVADNALLNSISNQISGSCWVSNGMNRVMGRQDNGSTGGWILQIDSTSHPEIWVDLTNGTTAYCRLVHSNTLTPNAWNNIAFSIDQTTGTVMIALNGVIQTTNGFNNICLQYIPQATNPGCSNMTIGWAWGGGVNYFSGGLDNIRLYSAPMSSVEVAALYVESN
jgi:hypothetical protein